MEKELLDNIINTTCSLINIKSVLDESTAIKDKPFGEGVYNALTFMLSLGEKMGFKTTNYDGYIGEIEYGEGDDFGVLCHLDTVPAGDGWITDPFSATIKDNKIYGRGAIDDKTPAVLILYALNELKNQGLKPKKKIKLILGCDEETSWRCIDHYNEKAKMPELGISPDADFPIINVEKGIISFNVSITDKSLINILGFNGGSAVNVVPNKCKASIPYSNKIIDLLKQQDQVTFDSNDKTINLNATGKSAHGSTPNLGINAITKMIYALSNITNNNILKELYNLLFSKDCLKNLNLNLNDKVSGNLTINPGVISLNKDTLNLLVDIRYPVTFEGENIIDTFKNAFPSNYKIEVIKHHAPLYVPASSELIKNLQTAYESVTHENAVLKSTGGGTYSRALKQAVAFGPLFDKDEDVVHMANEYINIDSLITTYEIYKKALTIICFD